MEFFKDNKITIFRTVGILMLIIGFVVQFWSMPKKGYTQDELASANIARMEASVGGKSTKKEGKKAKQGVNLKKLRESQAKQLRYLTILAMILGAGFTIYSFIHKPKELED